MERHVIMDAHNRFDRISKTAARKRFLAGEPFYIIAHKMRPGYPFSLGMTIDPKHYHDENRTFEQMINDFCFYNANCYETGTYAAYYVVSGGWEKTK